MCLVMEKAIAMMDSLPVSEEKPVKLNGVPYHSSLQEAVPELSRGKKGNFSCRLCSETVDEKLMRKHVGKHIFEDKLQNACRFCGLHGCTIDLITGPGRGKTAILMPGSNCTL